MLHTELDTLSTHTIRCLSIDAVQKANSGHPGLPLGAAPMAYVLWQYFLKHCPHTPSWYNRDRFVLSAGHGSMLLYSMLHLTGYDVSLDDLKNFRQRHSKTPGHPEVHLTPGVEATTGPLGQGCANAVGMAIAERMMAHQYNREGFPIVDHFTYALVSDGDLMEGISAEAASLAGHLKLGKLIYVYDANNISLDGPTDLCFTENVAARYESYGWHVLHVKNGDTDFNALHQALAAAKAHTSQPSLIVVNTTIGYGSPHKQGTASCHGSPLGAEEVKLTKQHLGFNPEESFVVPEKVKAHMQVSDEAFHAWNALFAAYQQQHPELAKAFSDAHSLQLPAQWDASLPSFKTGDMVATREASGAVLNALVSQIPWLCGGDADLSCSTLTALKGTTSFNGVDGSGRQVRYGVREHAMGAVANGIAYHGGLKHFVSTFFVFSDYMRPAVRLAALNGLPVVYVWTHDSIAVGEDGATHQPVEHLASWRAMPGLVTLRPCDAEETKEAWKKALSHKKGPVALVLSRQKLPVLDRTAMASASLLERGAYVLNEASHNKQPQALLMATGSEVHEALKAQALLEQQGLPTRVVSMPSWELFLEQPKEYQDDVLPPHITTRVAVEAGVRMGWDRFIGTHGAMVGVQSYGASAPGNVLLKDYGITPENIVATVLSLQKT